MTPRFRKRPQPPPWGVLACALIFITPSCGPPEPSASKPTRQAAPTAEPGADTPTLQPEAHPMAQDLNAVVASSAGPHAVMNAAVAEAASEDEANHVVLRRYLLDPKFLGQLDSQDEYSAPPQQLRLARVIKALMDNRSVASDKTLVTLVRDANFVSVEPRQELMIRALEQVRPAPPEAIAFWREHARPTAPYKHVAMDAMADNASAPALALFEQVMADPAHEPENKAAWMHDPILRNRYTPSVLAACERMLTTSLPKELRPELVASLYDYREKWYLSCTPPTVPQRASAKPEAKVILRRIADYALANVPLDAQTKAAVEADLEWLEK